MLEKISFTVSYTAVTLALNLPFGTVGQIVAMRNLYKLRNLDELMS